MVSTSVRSVLKQVSDIAAQSPDAALELLRRAIRESAIAPEEVEKAGRLVTRLRRNLPGAPPDLSITMLGQCTTSWLSTTLTAVGWGDGVSVSVSEGEYDNVLQELLSSSVEQSPKVMILLPWTQRLIHDPTQTIDERIENELAFWARAWELAMARGISRIIQVGYDWITPGVAGFHLGGAPGGSIALVRSLNERLRAQLPPGSYFVDLEMISGTVGRQAFYDPRRYYWTKQPFSEMGVLALAKHLWAGVRALMTGPRKVLVLDLDNTLWGGVVGETGPLGIALGESPEGEAYRAFQREVKALASRGVVLAISSKNNHDDAVSPFAENPQMVLALSDFAHIEANWSPKSESLQRIAAALSLGLDSLVFFDDNPAEREQIRQALPEVAVVDVPPDPAEYIRSLHDALWFETVALSSEDRVRSEQYQQENRRRAQQASFSSLEDYLASLEMQGLIADIDSTSMQRVVQLIGKTNQFNLTTRRHSQAGVEQKIAAPRAIALTLTLEDRFGQHGLVSVVLGEPLPDANDTLLIDTWLMSCRVIGRTAEEFMLNAVTWRAIALGYRRMRGEFIPTKKNAMVADLYDRFGFQRIGVGGDGTVIYERELTVPQPARTFVRGNTLPATSDATI